MPPVKMFWSAGKGITGILFVALFFLPVRSFSGFSYTLNCRDAYRAILGLRFGDTGRSLDKEKHDNPQNLLGLYLENYADFLAVFIGEEKTRYDSFNAALEGRMDSIAKGDPSSPYHSYCLGNMHLQRALLRMKFGEYQQGVMDMGKAYSDLSSGREKFPSFMPGLTGLGFIHVMVGLVPDSYRWLLDMLQIKGEVEQGLNEIGQVAAYQGQDPFTRDVRSEAVFFLAMADASLGTDRDEVLQALGLLGRAGNSTTGSSNPLFIFARASILIKAAENDRALETLEQYTYHPGEYPFYYLDYLVGKVKLNRLDPDASRYFIRFLKNFRGMNYIKSAYQRLSWCYLLNGDTARFREYNGKVLTRGHTFVEVDNQAEKEAASGEKPDLFLLRARLLCDGGYFDRALDELSGKPVTALTSPRDRVEYSYRMGRIWQGLGNDGKALDYFDRTIGESLGLPYYFGGNAALQSGLIYERQQNYRQAGKYFSLCISMDYTEYKTSLSRKARAGLKRISKFLD
jgi:tetratricopeptide (TPR) repeat protein